MGTKKRSFHSQFNNSFSEADILNHVKIKFTDDGIEDGFYSQRPRFAVLARCVRYLHKCLLSGVTCAIGFNLLLKGCKLQDLDSETKDWLKYEALPDNSKVECETITSYRYRAPYDILNSHDFVRLLRQHEHNSQGGIWLSDIKESLPNSEAILQKEKSKYTTIVHKGDKRLVIYYRNKSHELNFCNEVRQMWKHVSVKELSDRQIEDHLRKNGIKVFMGETEKQMPMLPPKLPSKPAHVIKLRDNAHVAHLMKWYDEYGNEKYQDDSSKENPAVVFAPARKYMKRH